jgi:cell division GTPase FtsZ
MPTTMLSNGQPVFRMGSKLFSADGTPVTQIDKPERKLSPTEMRLVDETSKRLNAGKEGLVSLNRAIELNPTAFEGSLSGARKMLGNVVGSEDPGFLAAEELDNTIIGSALAQMKTVFGANPTEGERKILLDMQGSSGKTRAVREKIFQNSRAAVQRRLEADAKTLEDIRSGSFGRVQPPASPTPGKPRVTNWKQ